MRVVASGPARLQVHQPPALGDKLMKYAASNWTLVNHGVGGWGTRGFEVKRKRHACEGRSAVHVDNIHFEYANGARGTQCRFHTEGPAVRLGLETKGATGHCEARTCARARPVFSACGGCTVALDGSCLQFSFLFFSLLLLLGFFGFFFFSA